MPSWSPEQYLKFEDQRTRPARDLAQAVAVVNPRRVIDLGCGPGNSTAVCAERWLGASIVGIDSSAAMIEKARAAAPEREWIVGDIAAWAREAQGERFDVIFANASLQWVDNHTELFPRLMARLAPGGALAVQMPSYEMTPNRVMREVAAELGVSAKEWRAHSLDFYYEMLRPCAGRLDLWATEYVQIMPAVEAIVEWYKGTGLRPYLDAIGEEGERERFLAEFGERLRPLYLESPAGGVLFGFRRVFVVGYAER